MFHLLRSFFEAFIQNCLTGSSMLSHKIMQKNIFSHRKSRAIPAKTFYPIDLNFAAPWWGQFHALSNPSEFIASFGTRSLTLLWHSELLFCGRDDYSLSLCWHCSKLWPFNAKTLNILLFKNQTRDDLWPRLFPHMWKLPLLICAKCDWDIYDAVLKLLVATVQF